MKNWSLGYELLRIYVRFAFWLTHKRIVVSGRNTIPKDKPIIFAANHQNALMDSLSLVCTNPRQSVWLARADIFKSKIARPILKFLKMAPVYRLRDGKDSLSNNEQIFALVTDILENKDSVCLFPEAAHSGRRQMLTHKKAIPRIALEAEEKNQFKLGLQIVPVGIFYSHYWAFDRSLLVQYGEPIEVDKYQEEYLLNPQKAMLVLRDEIYDRLAPLTIQINSESFYSDYENIRLLAGKTYSKTRHFSKNRTIQQFQADQDLVKKLEIFESVQPEFFHDLIGQTRTYFSELASKNLSDELVETSSKTGWVIFLLHFCFLALSMPVFSFGFIFNALPFFLPRNLFGKKVKDMAFMSTFNFASGLFIFPLIYFLESGIVFALTNSWAISVSCLILMPFIGKIAYKLLKFYHLFLNEMRFLFGNKTFRNDLKQLLIQRKNLADLIIEKIKL